MKQQPPPPKMMVLAEAPTFRKKQQLQHSHHSDATADTNDSNPSFSSSPQQQQPPMSNNSTKKSSTNRIPFRRPLGVLLILLALLIFQFQDVLADQPLPFWITTWSVAGSMMAIVLFGLLLYRRRHSCFAAGGNGCCRRRCCCCCRNDTNNNKNKNNPHSIRHQFQTILTLTKPYLTSSPKARVLMFLTILTLCLNSALSVTLSYAHKYFYNALNDRNLPEFQRAMVVYAGVVVAYAPGDALFTWRRDLMSVHWREWMTGRTLSLWGRNRVYYHLERRHTTATPITTTTDTDVNDTTTTKTMTKGVGKNDNNDNTQTQMGSMEIDNPDQRIAEDIDAFTTYVLKLSVLLLKNIISLTSFSWILYTIAPYLFLVILGYVFIGTVIAFGLGKPLLSLQREKLKREADLRFGLVRLRENAESVAFYDGADLELHRIVSRLTLVVSNRRSILWTQLKLEAFTNLYFYGTWIVPIALIAPQYFAGTMELGEVMQAREAFYHVVADVSLALHEFEKISVFLAGVWRLGSFYEVMRMVDCDRGVSSRVGLLEVCCNSGNGDYRSDEEEQASSSKMANTNTTTIQILPLPFPSNSNNKLSPPVILRLTSLTLSTPGITTTTSPSVSPSSRILIRNLNVTLYNGQNLLITGGSGTGKSSLLRCIAGLWNSGVGTVERPILGGEDVYFLPQRPYCPLGTLRDQLLYPSFADHDGDGGAGMTVGGGDDEFINNPRQRRNRLPKSSSFSSSSTKSHHHQSSRQQQKRRHNTTTDEELLSILNLVQLSQLASRVGNGNPHLGLYSTEDWSNMLSLGEQQRLAFARVFVNRPRLVIMDEATSALDMVTQRRLYGLLESMARASNNAGVRRGDGQSNVTMIPIEGGDGVGGDSIAFRPIEGGLTYVSVGHRPSLLAYHDKKLLLRGEETGGGHELSDIDRGAAARIADASTNILF